MPVETQTTTNMPVETHTNVRLARAAGHRTERSVFAALVLSSSIQEQTTKARPVQPPPARIQLASLGVRTAASWQSLLIEREIHFRNFATALPKASTARFEQTARSPYWWGGVENAAGREEFPALVLLAGDNGNTTKQHTQIKKQPIFTSSNPKGQHGS